MKNLSIKKMKDKDKLDDSISKLCDYAFNLHYIELIDIKEIDFNIKGIKKNYKVIIDIINKIKKRK